MYEELKGSCDDADINKRVSREISQAVKKSRRDMEKMATLDVKAKKMKVEWDRILNLSVGIKKMSDTYMVTYGELA